MEKEFSVGPLRGYKTRKLREYFEMAVDDI
jgi:hypothetical protein